MASLTREDRERHLAQARKLARVMDRLIGGEVGVDPLIGLVPIWGDLVSMTISGYMLVLARRLKMPRDKINTIAKRIVLDLAVGVIPIPVVEMILDAYVKPMSHALQLMEEHVAELDRHQQEVEKQWVLTSSGEGSLPLPEG